MPQLTGGEAIVQSLAIHGIDTVFGLPGVQTYGLFDALHQAQPSIRTVGARHEQGCGYMALGSAQATGKPSVFAVVPGPGMLNASAAMITAYSRNAPVLCITGQVPSSWIGSGKGQLHEMPDQLATLRTLTKWAERISRPDLVPELVAQAFFEMLSGRRRPVALEMPWDVFLQTGEVELMEPIPPAPDPEPDPDHLAAAAAILKTARAPMILLGSGAMDAGAEVLELADLLGAPIVPFRSGRGIVSDRHDLALTHASGYPLWHSTDVVIAIGTRMEGAHWRWPYVPEEMKYIRVDVDAQEMQRFWADAEIVAGARAGIRALIDAARRAGVEPSKRRDKIVETKKSTAREVRETLPQAAYLDVLRDVLPDDGVVVDEVCQAGFTSWFAYPVYRPRTFLGSGYAGTLGSGFPMALGVKVALPAKPVVSITGDGGFLFAATELATAVQYKIGVVTLLFNNNSYGNVLRDQKAKFGGRALGSELVNPDFVKFAESFGAGAARIRTPAELKPVLERALADGRPWVIEVVVERGGEGNPWRYIAPPRPG